MSPRKGVVLVTVLWILAILALLAVGMGLLSGGELSLMKMSLGKLRAYAAARAGIVYAEKALAKNPSVTDILGAVGVKEDPGAKDRFGSEVRLGDSARFTITSSARDYFETDAPKELLGLSDEAGRLNLNLVTSPEGAGAFILEDLVNALEPGSGRKISQALAAFRAPAAEDAAQRTLHFAEDLLLIEGVTPELFRRLKPFVTVYPFSTTPALRINLYTAPVPVVKAVFAGVAKQDKLGIDAGRDAAVFLKCRNEAVLSRTRSADQCVLPSYLSIYELGPFRSGIYRVRSVGIDDESRRCSIIEAVVTSGQGEFRVLSWRRE
jgi:type II secretory pathway component PulK